MMSKTHGSNQQQLGIEVSEKEAPGYLHRLTLALE